MWGYIWLNVKSCGCGILRYLLDQDAPENLWAQISHHIFPHVHHIRYEQYGQCWLHDVYHTQLCQQLLQRFLPHSYQRLKELTCPRTMECQSWLRKLQFITDAIYPLIRGLSTISINLIYRAVRQTSSEEDMTNSVSRTPIETIKNRLSCSIMKWNICICSHEALMRRQCHNVPPPNITGAPT